MSEHPQYGYPSVEEPSFQGTTPAPASPKTRTGLLIGTVLVLALAIGGYFAFRSTLGPAAATPVTSPTTKAPTKLEAAVQKCYPLGTDATDLGHTLTLRNVAAKEDPGPVAMDGMQCVFGELDVPQSVLVHIGQTRAMDGMQTDSWDGMNVRWNYHPDNGINITFTDSK
jgi:hypothetical protein